MARLPKIRGRLCGASALCLAAGLGLVVLAPASRAQESGALRGSITDADLDAGLLRGPAGASKEQTGSIESGETTGGASSNYDPVSQGSLPDDGATIAAGSGVTDPFAEEAGTNQAGTASPPPSTARAGRDNPYAPLGLRVGTFIAVPTLEQGLEWSSNANAVPNGESALLSDTTLRLDARSDWSRHSATVDAYGTYRESVSGADVSDFEGGVDAGLRLDLGAGLRALADIGYTIAPEDASSPVVIANVVDRPLRQTIDGGLGIEKDAGKLRLGLFGNASRDQYGDATLQGGTKLSQSDRNSTLVAARLRGGYAISPAITPFVEGEIGRRIYDDTRDSRGYERSATRLGARAGIALDLREKLTGEASLGWISEDPDDARLGTISGLAAAANLSWSPIRGTIVRLDGTTTVETTTDPGDSGSLLYSGQVTVEREIRDNLTGTAVAGAAWRDYSSGGSEVTLFGQAGLTWWLNRNLGLTGRVRHESLTSTLAGRDYEVSSVFLGMKLQR